MKDSGQTYYDVLGVPPTARLSDIKQAFRQLARRYHPDLHPNDRNALETFQEISRAYQVLSDPASRQKYDQRLQGDRKGDEASQRSNRTAGEWYQKGLEYSQRSQYEKAIEAYTEAIVRNSELLDAYNQRGFCHYKLGQQANAFADYAQSIQRNEAQATPYYYRGLTRFHLGYIEAAIADYTQAIEYDPNHGQAYYQRGVAYADINESRLAMVDWKAAEDRFMVQGETRRGQEAHRAYESIVRRQGPLSQLRAAFLSPSDAFMVVFRISLNPIGGGVEAFDRLTPPRAFAVGILLGVWFDLCFTYGVISLLTQRSSVNVELIWRIVGLGLLPFLFLIVSSTLGRILFSQQRSVTGDVFIAGVALLPISIAVLAIGKTSGLIALTLGGLGIVHMVLTLYGQCRYILRFKHKVAALWVPIMLLVAFLPLSAVR